MLTYSFENLQGKSKYEHLYACIKGDILSGVLSENERLPSKRTLAEHLGLSVVTVETAYAQLLAEGYIYSRPRSGFFVSGTEKSAVPHAGLPTKTSKSISQEVETDPQADTSAEFPFSVLTRIMRQVMAEYGDRLLTKPPHNGCAVLRQAIAEHLRSYRGMSVSPENIVVGSGAEYLYGLVAQLFGTDTVFGLEDPSYSKIRMVYEAHGIRCEPLIMDQEGISPDALAGASADVLHITPFNSYPSGVTAPASRRYEYLAWAKERAGYIIEDDFASEFSLHRMPLETVYSMDDSGRVVYMNTFSKSLAPSIRMGYMVLPDGLLERYEARLGFYSCTVPSFDQYVLAEFISQGYFERHLNRIRRRLRQK